MSKQPVTPLPVGEQPIFRLKRNSKLIDVMKYFEEHPRAARKDVVEALHVGYAEVAAIQMMARYSDNYTIGHYVSVQPNITVEQAILPEGGGLPGLNQLGAIDEIRWPQTPLIEDPLAWFRKPEWYKRMAEMVELGQHIALNGPPGIGKSTAVRALAAERHKPLVHVSADVGLRRRDLTGSVELVRGQTQFLVAEYAAAAVFGWWAKVDEVNAAEPDALLFMNSQLEEPRMVNFHGKAYPVHPDFRCFVTYNPGLIGTKPLPQSFLDRFFPIKQGFPTAHQLKTMLLIHGGANISETDLDTIVNFGQAAWKSHNDGNMRYQITPRRLQQAIQLVQLGENVRDALIATVLDIVDNPAEVAALERVLRERVGY